MNRIFALARNLFGRGLGLNSAAIIAVRCVRKKCERLLVLNKAS
jgi:hypothetical protein